MKDLIFHINSDNGHLKFFPFQISWGNALKDIDLPGFFCLSVGDFSLEFGDVDQGKPGIYLVRFFSKEPVTIATIWSAKS